MDFVSSQGPFDPLAPRPHKGCAPAAEMGHPEALLHSLKRVSRRSGFPNRKGLAGRGSGVSPAGSRLLLQNRSLFAQEALTAFYKKFLCIKESTFFFFCGKKKQRAPWGFGSPRTPRKRPKGASPPLGSPPFDNESIKTDGFRFKASLIPLHQGPIRDMLRQFFLKNSPSLSTNIHAFMLFTAHLFMYTLNL